MKTSFKLRSLFIIAIVCLCSGAAMAQMNGKKAPLSPRDSVSGTVNGAMLNINYGAPSVRGRKIFDSLEVYGKVWRAGANEATRFTTNKAIKVNGKPLAAGTYGFFLIPTAKKWTVIFNSQPNQWGAFKYDSTKDVLRFKVRAKKIDKQERLVYKITDKGFEMDWDKVAIPVKVK